MKPRRVDRSKKAKIVRKERAAERAALHVCTPQCKRFRTGKVEWIDA